MIIQGDFFKIIPVSEKSLFYDLKLLKKIGGKNSREEFVEAGNGITLERALNKCIKYAIERNFEVLSLQEFLQEYKNALKEVRKIYEESLHKE